MFQRLTAFCEDNLITTDSNIQHHGVSVDEDVSPFMENIIVVLCLQHIHPDLPALVKQRYGTELRNKSLASLKPEISQALASLVEELKVTDDGRALRTFANFPTKDKFCILCHAKNRPFKSHYLADCRFLPDADRKRISRSGQSRSKQGQSRWDEAKDSQHDEALVRMTVTQTFKKTPLLIKLRYDALALFPHLLSLFTTNLMPYSSLSIRVQRPT